MGYKNLFDLSIFNNFFIKVEDIPENALQYSYDYGLVGLSFAQAVIASFLAITIINYATNETSRKHRFFEEILASLMMGFGIWTMHFTGMLAMKTDMVHSLDTVKTMISIVPPIIFSWIAFNRISRPNYTILTALSFAPFLGLGVAFMHYLGIYAMDMQASLYHTSMWFGISIAIAVIASAAGMHLLSITRRLNENIQTWRIIIAIILGLAVCGLHYSGMKAMVIIPYADCRFDSLKNNQVLVLLITLGWLVGSLGLFTIFLIYKNRQKSFKNRPFEYINIVKKRIVAILIGGIILGFLIPFWVHKNEEEKHNQLFESELKNLSKTISRELESNIHNALATSGLYAASGSVDPEEFEIFAKNIIYDETNIHYIAYVPENKDSDEHILIYPKNIVSETSFNKILFSKNLEIANLKNGVGSYAHQQVFTLAFPVKTRPDEFGKIISGTIIASLSFSNFVDGAFRKFSVPNISWSINKVTNDDTPLSIEIKNALTGSFLKLFTIYVQTSHKALNKVSGFEILLGVLIIFISISICIFMLSFIQHKRKDQIYKKGLEIKIAEVERANSVKDSFFANMTHELRTPLNSIIGMLGFLRETSLNIEQEEMIETTLASSNILLQIINSILDLSKIEAGEVKLEKIGFDLLSLTQRAFRFLQPLSAQKGISFKIEYDKNTLEGPYLIGDPFRITQVITNLLSNAIKYTEHGSVTLSISSQKIDGETIMVEIHVIDTGIGIPEDKLLTVFEKFSQADTSTTRKYGGTGLGLSIAYKIVEMMGGQINVKSKVGKGSDFYFSIPFVITDELETERNISKNSSAITNNAIFKKSETKIPINLAHILIAEDHPMNQLFIKKMMERFGNDNYTLVENGFDAVSEFKKANYDIILMDCFMPLKNGYDASLEIRNIENTQGHENYIPIIAMTANAMSGDSQKCFEAKMTAYIPKPINVSDLKALLSAWINFDIEQSNIIDEKTNEAAKELDIKNAIDLSNLREFAQGDDELLLDMIKTFVEQTDINMTTLQNNITEGENKIWSDAAHMLKGGAGGVGAEYLRKLAEDAQNMLSATQDDRSVKYKAIETAYLSVKNKLRDQGFSI